VRAIVEIDQVDSSADVANQAGYFTAMTHGELLR